jgi:hypothetical protein
MAALNTRRMSKDECEKRGWRYGDVDCFCYHSKRWRDLFGVIDLIAIADTIVGIQFTSRANISSRHKKMLESDDAMAWLETGNRLLVWGWDRVKDGRKLVPRLKEVELALSDF